MNPDLKLAKQAARSAVHGTALDAAGIGNALEKLLDYIAELEAEVTSLRSAVDRLGEPA